MVTCLGNLQVSKVRVLSPLQTNEFMDRYDSNYVCKQVKDLSPKVILSFSMGKDSIASYIKMLEYWDISDIEFVFLYMVPGLSFQQEQIRYYERMFGKKIKQMPNPSLPAQINAFMYQCPSNIDTIVESDLYQHTYDEVFAAAKADFKLPESTFVGVGVRSADSMMRMASIKRYGAINHTRKQFFPVFDWKISDIVREVSTSNIKLPIDYRIWGKTFDGFDYRFLSKLKQFFPDDYNKVQSFFPFIDLEFKRYERYGRN